jgi:hypothetical protein
MELYNIENVKGMSFSLNKATKTTEKTASGIRKIKAMLPTIHSCLQ